MIYMCNVNHIYLCKYYTILGFWAAASMNGEKNVIISV